MTQHWFLDKHVGMLRMEIERSDLAMMRRGKMFGEVVAVIIFAALPIDFELTLANPISHPVKAHVDGFGAPLFHCVVDDALGTGVVCLDGCRWLGVS